MQFKTIFLTLLSLSGFFIFGATASGDERYMSELDDPIPNSRTNGNFSRESSTDSLYECLKVKDPSKTVKVAIVGGGGAGVITTALLSNLSKKSNDITFEITLFERNKNLINGSTFETAAVLHAGGNEYSKDHVTAAQCQMAGELFAKIFPDLYGGESTPILFVVNPSSNLTAKEQKDTHLKAKNLNRSLNKEIINNTESSQTDVPEELLKKIFCDKL